MTSHEGLILALKIIAAWAVASVIAVWLLTWRSRRDRRESLNQHHDICERLGLPRRRK